MLSTESRQVIRTGTIDDIEQQLYDIIETVQERIAENPEFFAEFETMLNDNGLVFIYENEAPAICKKKRPDESPA